MSKARKNDELKKTEKKLIKDIQDITAEHKRLQNEFTKEKEENDIEVAKLKKDVNETQVEKELNLQYLELTIEGELSMVNRINMKE